MSSSTTQTPEWAIPLQRLKRAKTPTVLQMEAVECGAAALGIILGYYGRFVPLEELRLACGVSRDGSKASNVVRAARRYGMEAKGFRKEPQDLAEIKLPFIIFWNFNHFLVVEGFGKDKVFLNDPGAGPRAVSYDEFDKAFTGVVLDIQPGETFEPGGERDSLLPGLRRRFANSGAALAYIVLAGLGVTITSLFIPIFSQVFVDGILVQGHNWIGPLLWGMGLTAVLRAAFSWLQQVALARFETKLAVSMASQFLWHILRLPVEFFNQRYAGDVNSRVGLNDKVARLLSGDLATTVINGLLIVFYVAIMLWYDVALTLLGIAFALINLLALRFISRKRSDSNRKLIQERGKMLGTAFSGLTLIETMKAGGTENDFFVRWAGYQARALTAQQQLGLATQFLATIPPLLSAFSVMAILVVGSLRVIEGQITVGMLVAFQSLMVSFLAPVNQFVSLGGTLQEIGGDLKRLDDVLHYAPEPTIAADDLTAEPNQTLPKLTGHLELRNVTFGYSPLDPPLITALNLTIKPGARVALVGGSGSGKSTVARLVAGLYQPWEGEILFDGRPRESWPRDVIVDSLAMVDQDILLFASSVRENLTLWDRSIPETAIIQAAKDAHIHDEITARNGGYDSAVAEGGRNFSGGQRQRLEIARAMVNNPTLLVLDEATSALDPITEEIIDQHLRRRGCACLIVAHRLSSIRDCDEIIVLENGKVVQRGTHDQMIRLDGPYSRLIASGGYEKKKSALDSIFDKL